MSSGIEIVLRLTSPELPNGQRRAALRDFAQTFGWRPSDEIDEYPGTERIANGHLIIEYGLENTAVITFLKADCPFRRLTPDVQARLLSISYNNLVDWHLFPDQGGTLSAFNRTEPLVPHYLSRQEEPNVWKAQSFEQLVRQRPPANIKALDDALVETISSWRRIIASELSGNVRSEQLSNLFNAILLVRGVEDHHRTRNPNSTRILVDRWLNSTTISGRVAGCIRESLSHFDIKEIPAQLVEEKLLDAFDDLDPALLESLFSEFYRNKFAPYEYDFSLISKHALSKIYERYIAELRSDPSAQLTFFPDLPEEWNDRMFGGIYTPLFIARFFARFLKENLPPRAFRSLRSIDPACGSGIFLRTLLEMRCDPWQEVDAASFVEHSFENITGIDVDPNACHAARLSLSLLYLVLTGDLPRNLNILKKDALDLESGTDSFQAFDAVIANPPFLPWKDMNVQTRQKVQERLAALSTGRPDLFLAMLKVGLDVSAPGAFLLFVLPHSFLLSNSAKRLRDQIARDCWIRILVDLSEISVFEGVGTYVVLLVLQRRFGESSEAPKAQLVKCRAYVGRALQDVLENRFRDTDAYTVFEAPQSIFKRPNWLLLSPKQYHAWAQLEQLPTLDTFFHIREGFVSGSDAVFIRSAPDVPSDERAIYAPYLSDRQMTGYSVPSRPSKYVFFPFVEGKRIEEKELRLRFPKTWQYLLKHKPILSKRTYMRAEWWRPTRSRSPEAILRPKIVSPHLVLLPRFCLDARGRFAVSHGPYMYPKSEEDNIVLLRYFLAVLNSSVCAAQIALNSHKYGRGYLMLEPKTLRALRVPSPDRVSVSKMKDIQKLVIERIEGELTDENDMILDRIILNIYGLSEEAISALGIQL